jgi:hypothetical protein
MLRNQWESLTELTKTEGSAERIYYNTVPCCCYAYYMNFFEEI